MNKLKVKSKYLILGLLMVVFGSYSAMANNIQVSNVVLHGQNTIQNYSMIKFDLGWDNSWKVFSGPSNWDAAWVFVKYRRKAENIWHHAKLSYVDGTNDGHIISAGGKIELINDNPNSTGTSYANGVFVSRVFSTNSPITVNYNVELKWNYFLNNLTDQDSVEIRVFAIEMVYVNQGAFYVGSGGEEENAFYKNPFRYNPYKILSESAITLGGSGAGLSYDGQALTATTLPAEYPKGYDAFYCMKYEITYKQYAEFFNTFDLIILTTGFNSTFNGYVDYYVSDRFTPFNVNWDRASAYLDWAALRPMTELEYEKACRGPNYPLKNEYVWGTNFVRGLPYTYSGTEYDSNTVITNNYANTYSAGNCSYAIYDYSSSTYVGELVRVGIFSDNVLNTGRITSGATYYGIMEMAGNLAELVISVNTSAAQVYNPINGDGELDANNKANQSTWPLPVPLDSRTIIARGGSYNEGKGRLRTSDRYYFDLSSSGYSPNTSSYTIRGVRLAP